jgi:hypothetical protein
MDGDYKKVNRSEVLNGDTFVVACSVCPLDQPVDDEEGRVLDGSIMCVNGTLRCPHFHSIWDDLGSTFIQCSKLTDIDEYVGAPFPYKVQ